MTTPAKTYLATWRSTQAEERFREAEAHLWAGAAAAEPDSIEVETRFGPTHAYRWPGSGTPLVFLHGMGDTSRRWIPYAESLPDRDVYALDVMGDVGRSEQLVGFTSGADYGPWLREALDGLGVEKPHLVGMSLGGYVALQLAAQFPDAAASLVLFDPVGIVELRMARFMRWGMGNGVAAMMPRRVRTALAERRGMPPLADKAEARQLIRAQLHHPPAMPPLKPLTDEQLRSITRPVQVITGANTQAFGVDAMVDKVRSVLADATVDVLPDAGHALALTHFPQCLQRLKALP